MKDRVRIEHEPGSNREPGRYKVLIDGVHVVGRYTSELDADLAAEAAISCMGILGASLMSAPAARQMPAAALTGVPGTPAVVLILSPEAALAVAATLGERRNDTKLPHAIRFMAEDVKPGVQGGSGPWWAHKTPLPPEWIAALGGQGGRR